MMTSFSPPRVHQGSKVNLSELKQLLKQYPIPQVTQPNPNPTSKSTKQPFAYEYGTAGFRYHHTLLPPIMIRMGILSSLRSASLDGESVGIMVTASHNPENDNGVKLSDSNGGMLPPRWEQMATKIANASEERLSQWLEEKMSSNGTGTGADSDTGSALLQKSMIVHIGRDTRSHSSPLSQIAIRAAVALGATVIDHGCVTTPQLHYFVLRSNMQNMPNALLSMSSGIGFERDYIEGIIGTYISLIGTRTGSSNSNGSTRERTMVVDCACGIGGLKVPILNSMLRQCEQEGGISPHVNCPMVKLIPLNLPGDGPLNENCGAEYVQKQQKIPNIYKNGMKVQSPSTMDYVASLDGDADRIVFHYTNDKGQLVLLDGDKIAVLVSSFLQEELDALALAVQDAKNIKCGVVQTAYANGSSTNHLKNTVKTNVVVAKTGVKYVHAAAHSNFDVGTYFEANGHGTVLFGPKFYELLSKAETALLSTCRFNRANVAWQRLRVIPRLVNQAVGDALSDLLLVDAILYLKGWTLQNWNGLYKDLPSRQCKVKVKDRSLIHTNDNETKATAPPLLQPALETAMSAHLGTSKNHKYLPPPRAFVRPSGTENVVRIYAEASTQIDADALASEAAALVYKLCDGVGDIPNFVRKSNL